MAVCPAHGREFDLNAWICPVCNNDRCQECDYIECVVDNRKKDYECSFKCGFCDGMAGNDHRVKCTVCGAVGCSECIKQNAIDHKPICPDCGFMCVVCQKTYSNLHMENCDICRSHICTICKAKECKICGKSTCHAHSFRCPECGDTICKECIAGVDALSGDRLCSSCIHKCPGCNSIVPKSAAMKCSECNSDICRKCAKECAKCHKSFCKSHINRCAICNETVCVNHSDICPACGGHSCNEHFFKCDMCGIGYCSKCRPYKEERICNLCDNLSPLKTGEAADFLEKLKKEDSSLKGLGKWHYSTGRDVYIFYGKGLLANYIIVADKKTGKILKSNKIGLMDKMKKMFSS